MGYICTPSIYWLEPKTLTSSLELLLGFISYWLAMLCGPTAFIGLNVLAPRSLLLWEIFAFCIRCDGTTAAEEPVPTLVMGWLLWTCLDPPIVIPFLAPLALVLL